MDLLHKIGPVGPSLGWFFAKLRPYNLSLYARAAKEAWADAVELTVMDSDRRPAILAAPPLAFPYVSLHLFKLMHFEGEGELTIEQRNELLDYMRICQHHHVQAAPAHPDITPARALQLLTDYSVPVAIENMDRLKTTGRFAEELSAIAGGSEPRYVLDLQHAYEHAHDRKEDPVAFMQSLLRVMGDHLVHLHVSGEIVVDGKQAVQHAQLHVATNRHVIMRMLIEILRHVDHPIPVILEGDYLLPYPVGYTPRSDDERAEIVARVTEEMRHERKCLLNAL